jgi:hypothetical protein
MEQHMQENVDKVPIVKIGMSRNNTEKHHNISFFINYLIAALHEKVQASVDAAPRCWRTEGT